MEKECVACQHKSISRSAIRRNVQSHKHRCLYSRCMEEDATTSVSAKYLRVPAGPTGEECFKRVHRLMSKLTIHE